MTRDGWIEWRGSRIEWPASVDIRQSAWTDYVANWRVEPEKSLSGRGGGGGGGGGGGWEVEGAGMEGSRIGVGENRLVPSGGGQGVCVYTWKSQKKLMAYFCDIFYRYIFALNMHLCSSNSLFHYIYTYSHIYFSAEIMWLFRQLYSVKLLILKDQFCKYFRICDYNIWNKGIWRPLAS